MFGHIHGMSGDGGGGGSACFMLFTRKKRSLPPLEFKCLPFCRDADLRTASGRKWSCRKSRIGLESCGPQHSPKHVKGPCRFRENKAPAHRLVWLPAPGRAVDGAERSLKDSVLKDCVCVLRCVQLSVTPWTVSPQSPLSMGFSSKNTGVG